MVVMGGGVRLGGFRNGFLCLFLRCLEGGGGGGLGAGGYVCEDALGNRGGTFLPLATDKKRHTHEYTCTDVCVLESQKENSPIFMHIHVCMVLLSSITCKLS